jgi:hypothetical protein
MSDINFSPFPDHGKWFYFTWRKATSVRARPDYARDNKKLTLSDLKSFSFRDGKYPFFSWDFGFWHGYIGWKPINVREDPAFYWREHPEIQKRMEDPNILFVQLSVRQGFGDIG